MKLKNVFFLICCCLTAACQDNDTPADNTTQGGNTDSNTRAALSLTEAEKQMATLSSEFTFRLFQAANNQLADEEKGQLLVSPLSASIALSMVANGAAGETQAEITKALGMAGFSVDELNGYNEKLVKELATLDPDATFCTANSIWLNKDFNILAPFQQTLQERYEAEVQSKDFAANSTLQAINDWCSQKTRGLIPNLLDGLNSNSKLILLNALYFKGAWKDAFDPKETAKGTFTANDRTEQEGDFMHQEHIYWYASNDYLSMAELDYGNSAFSLVLLLPHEGITAETCIERLNGQEWVGLQQSKTYKHLDLKLPKFTIADKNDLNETLRTLGIEQAFTDEANFTSLADKAIKIEEVKQANSFSINETGAEAASATEINMGGSLVLPDELQEVPTIIDFHVQRPFLFLLKEQSSGIILQAGKVNRL